MLDEPTAALASQEIERLLALVRDLRGRGVACIYISHKLDEVFSIADRITVLRDGESIGTLSAAQTNPAEVIRLMVGRTIEDLYPRRSSTPGRPMLEIEALSVAEHPGVPAFLRDLSLVVHAGEVLGIGGLMGAGRSELLMHLFGVWGHRVAGRVLVNSVPMPTATPASALQSGLALVTEDRKRFGLVMEQASLSICPSPACRAWSATCCCSRTQKSRARARLSRASTSRLTRSTRRCRRCPVATSRRSSSAGRS